MKNIIIITILLFSACSSIKIIEVDVSNCLISPFHLCMFLNAEEVILENADRDFIINFVKKRDGKVYHYDTWRFIESDFDHQPVKDE